MKIKIDESAIEYRQPKLKIGIVMVYLSRWLRNIATIIPIIPPYNYKGIRGWFKILKADEVGRTIRVEPKIIEEGFEVHKDRLKLYDALSNVSYFIFAFIMGVVLFIFIVYVNFQAQSSALKSLITGSFSFISLVIGILSAILAAKVVGILLDRLFADSLILPSSLYLVIDLKQYDDLSNPDFRRNVLERIRTLRRNTLLLSQTFTNNLEHNQEAVMQLRSIEAYIREREGWVITPKKNTLSLLRNDFDKLALILISGQYGEFKSKAKRKPTEIAPSTPLSFADKVLGVIFTVFPYVLLAMLYFVPDYISNIGIDTNVAFLISIAWILLTIDARLKLGLVDRVTGLAKTMKELR